MTVTEIDAEAEIERLVVIIPQAPSLEGYSGDAEALAWADENLDVFDELAGRTLDVVQPALIRRGWNVSVFAAEGPVDMTLEFEVDRALVYVADGAVTKVTGKI